MGILASRTSKTEQEKLKKFFILLDERMEQAKDALMHRYNILKKLKAKDLPFVIGQKIMKGSENLEPDDSIEPVLKQGSWSIGFIGLAETLVALVGEHHGESTEARTLGYKIIQHIRNYTNKLAKDTQLNWSTYATPAEGLSGKFTVQDQKLFGIVPGVTDKEYYTNSYHVPVGYFIAVSKKLEIEAPFHKMCNAGHISYLEFDSNPSGEVIEEILRWAYTKTDISYIGMNFHIRYCKECGTYLVDEKFCPTCGSYDIQGISRVTGYLSLDERFGGGKSAERADRVAHGGSHKHVYNE